MKGEAAEGGGAEREGGGQKGKSRVPQAGGGEPSTEGEKKRITGARARAFSAPLLPLPPRLATCRLDAVGGGHSRLEDAAQDATGAPAAPRSKGGAARGGRSTWGGPGRPGGGRTERARWGGRRGGGGTRQRRAGRGERGQACGLWPHSALSH